MLTQPTKFGPYLLLERISLGGMAEVFKAIEFGIEGFERTVAVKRILPHVAEDEEFIAMFKDEAHIAVQLQHGNIAQIYSLGHEDDSFYIALEYVAGRDVRTMFDRCRKQKTIVPIAQTCFIVMKVCEGLDYAHNKKDKYGRPLNIIHRDVSPPNILVSYEGAVKLCDFGVAKAAGRVSQTQAGILKGKFGYMSPEQVRGHALDRRSDVFSAGVCLWEMLTGQRLFHGESDFATLEKVRSGEVQAPRELNSEIPAELEVIVLKALAPNPHDRFQSAAELHDRLQGFLFNQGLFYSRKDLAGWMRVHYAQDIESEKIREQQRAGIVREFKGSLKISEGAPGQSGADSRGKSTAGPKPPPPPPPSAVPGGEAVPVRRSMAPTLANISASASLPSPRNRPAPPQPRGRAKTLLSSALGPGIITPPPQPAVTPASNSAGEGSLRSSSKASSPSSPAKRSMGAQALADLNSIPTPMAAPKPFSGPQKSANLEWDDDELETHLFAQKGENRDEEQEDVPAKLASPIVRSKDSKRVSRSPLPVENKSAAQSGSAFRLPKPFASTSPSAVSPTSSSKLPPPVLPPRVDDPIEGPASLFSVPPEIGGENPHAPQSISVSQQSRWPDPQGLASDFLTDSPSSINDGRVKFGNSLLSEFSTRSSGLFAVDEGRGKAWKKWSIAGGIVLLLGLGFLMIDSFSNGSTADDSKSKQAAAAKKQVGTLQLTVSPHASKVMVNGRPYPGGASRTVDRLKAGMHKLTVSAGPDYLPQELEVKVEDGKITKSKVVLQPRNVNLVGSVTPSTGTVFLISGQEETKLGSGTFKHVLHRDPGVDYSLRVEADGHKTKEQPLEFSGQSEINLSIELEVERNQAPRPNVGSRPSSRGTAIEDPIDELPSPSKIPRSTPPRPTVEKTAGLKIGTEPGLPPATVYLNGRVVSQRTPVLIEVRPGNYKIEWEWANGKRSSKKISVKDGQTALVKGDY